MLGLESLGPLLRPEHRELAARLEESLTSSIAPLPHVEEDDAVRGQARKILELLGREGWSAYAVPPAYGGAEEAAGLISCCLIRESLAWHSPLADAVFALQCLGAAPLITAGSEELKLEWLPAVATGHAMAAFAITESEAGSDLRGMQTSATREGDEYVLEGQKCFISNAGLAEFYVVFARLETDTDEDTFAAFLVPAGTKGLEFSRPQFASAPHPLGEIRLEGCRVPEAQRLGEEGEGLELALSTLDRLRATVAAAACGMAGRALEEAQQHAAEREQFGRHLEEFQLVQAKLADMATELAAARLLTYRAAHASDSEEDGLKLRSAQAKLFATEAAQRIVDQAVQVLGGRGVLADSPVEHLYRAVRALRIYEGTSEIQQLVIARQLRQG